MKPLPLLLALVSLFQALGSSNAAEAKRKNVLFIVSDDLNNRLSCYGDPQVQSPNVDRLAKRGTLFEQAYCTYPLCGPSRNSFLTGLYPNSTGIFGNGQIFRQTIPDQESLPQLFRKHGYLSARVGKLYHYSVPKSIGTDGHDDPASWEIQMNPAGVDRTVEEPNIFSLTPGQFGGSLSWYSSPNKDSLHTDGLNAADAQWILERCATQPDRPFFLALGFFRPHTPYVSPNKYFEKYPPTAVPIVKGVNEDLADIPAPALESKKKEQENLSEELQRKAIQAYYASISFMDAQLGLVLDTLDRLGLSKDTIIVFTSDHGYHLGEHGLWQKLSLFEESTRVPLLVIAPGMKEGARAKSPVSHVDLLPTLTELCGLPSPSYAQGQSLVPFLKDSSVKGRGWALSQVVRGSKGNAKAGGGQFNGYSLRTERWRYTEWDGGKKGRELYDHRNDPHELTNLADKEESQETVKQLSTELKAAVASSLPKSGTPPVVENNPNSHLWNPSFIE